MVDARAVSDRAKDAENKGRDATDFSPFVRSLFSLS
jgi:hypothetical protein